MTGIPSSDHLVYNLTQLDIAGNVTATSFTLAAAASPLNIHAGGSATIAATVTNVGTGTADALAYSGLGFAASGGTVGGPTGSGTLALAAAGSNSQSFASNLAGSFTLTPAVTATNATLGSSAFADGHDAGHRRQRHQRQRGVDQFVGLAVEPRAGNWQDVGNAAVQSRRACSAPPMRTPTRPPSAGRAR